MRRSIGMIFQHFNLVKRSTVLRNVLSGRVGYHPTWKMILGLFPKEDKVKAMNALERVNILDKYDQRSDQLSGGQQQRISIASVMSGTNHHISRRTSCFIRSINYKTSDG